MPTRGQSLILPEVQLSDDGETFTTNKALPFRMSVTLAARALMGISYALHRIADEMQRKGEA